MASFRESRRPTAPTFAAFFFSHVAIVWRRRAGFCLETLAKTSSQTKFMACPGHDCPSLTRTSRVRSIRPLWPWPYQRQVPCAALGPDLFGVPALTPRPRYTVMIIDLSGYSCSDNLKTKFHFRLLSTRLVRPFSGLVPSALWVLPPTDTQPFHKLDGAAASEPSPLVRLRA